VSQKQLKGKLYLIVLFMFFPFLLITLFNTLGSVLYLLFIVIVSLIYLYISKDKKKITYIPLIFTTLNSSYLLFSYFSRGGIISSNSIDMGIFQYLFVVFLLFSIPLQFNSAIALIVVNREKNQNYKFLNNSLMVLEILFFFAFILLPYFFLKRSGFN
jgi:hypothetical protein